MSGTILRLHLIDGRCIVNIVTEEVNRLTSGVNFSLIDVFALSEHGGSIHDRTIFRGKQLSHFHHDGSTSGPRSSRPLLVCFHGSFDGHFHFLATYFVISGKHMLVVVRTSHLTRVTRADFLTAYDNRYVNNDFRLAFQFLFKCNALWRTYQIALHWFIGRCWKCDYRIVHEVRFS